MYKLLFFVIAFNFAILPQLRIKAVGDIMPGSYTPASVIPPDSGKVFIDNIKSYLSNADIVFGNFEGTIANITDTPKKCSDSSRIKGICFEFGVPVYLAGTLKNLGFNLLNLDNNHSEDYGISNYNLTKKVFKNLNVNVSGKRDPVIITVKDQQVAVISFGFSGRSYPITDIPAAKNIVASYAKKYKIVIVSFHGGAEGKSALYVPDSVEVFYGEKRGNLIKFSKAMIDAGADLILGHGPHVLRALELYKNKLIAYSLGNFLTYGNVNINGVNGVTAILDVNIDSEGNFSSGIVIPVIQKNPGIPVYDKELKAISLINKLNKALNSSVKLILDDNGKIIIKQSDNPI